MTSTKTESVALLQLIQSRRSIRAYRAEEVGEEPIQRLLEAAMAAPSAVGKDPWRFVIVRAQATRDALADVLPNGPMLRTAPVGIVVAGDLEVAHDRQISYLLQDCAAAIENLLLAAHALGLGTCWLGVHPREGRIAAVKRILSLPENFIPVSAISVGWPGEVKESRTRFNPAYVQRERWGG
jgi:nitroreductase